MALPALALTHRFQVNQTIAGQATTLAQSQNLLFALVQSLLALGSWTDLNNAALAATGSWTVVSSCDSATAAVSSTSKWVTAANLVWSAGAHSWIVVQQTGVGTKFQILIDLGSGTNTNATIKVSHTGFGAANGGVDGNTTTAPTALNSVTLVNGAAWGSSSSTTTATVLSVTASQDGKATRFVLFRASFAVAHWHFSLPGNAASGWTNPYAVYINAQATQGADVETFANVCAVSSKMIGIANAGTSITLLPGTDGITGSSQIYPAIFTAAGSFSGAYPMFGIVLACLTAGSVESYVGVLTDLWFGITAHTTGAGYPGAAVDAVHPRQFLKAGPFIYPWNNSVAVIS